MDAHSPSPNEQLVDHLLLVGPGKGMVFNTPTSSSLNSSSSSWCTIRPPQPTIIRSFPEVNSEHGSMVTSDVAYFCQPDGCSIDLPEQRMHHFMLTDTETNRRTYGICLSFSHLFDPTGTTLRDDSGGEVCPLDDSHTICIQEWGILSLCVLSHHPFFTFFQKTLLSLHHFVEHFFGEDLTWNALIHTQEGEGGGEKRALIEIEKWISQLLSMRAPQQGQSALEVELEVDPAVTVAMPPTNRFPLLDLCVSQLFQQLGVCSVIEIFKLVLAEQKVILVSEDVAFVSDCVLILLSLLYPLQYLFPCIPLLPTSMPTAENLLMVPTPFFIGVHKSFLEKMAEPRHPEAWVVNLDRNHFEPPSCPDQQTITDFPYSILQLQADIRKVLDYLDKDHLSEWDEEHSVVSFATHTTIDDHPGSLKDEIDVMIRIAFVEFLFSPEILGSTEQHMCVYRLFTRPVVAIRTTAFIHGYQKSCPTTNTEFIQNLIRSQGIEYFFEWRLNPSNTAFSEIRRGIHAVDRLSDKQYHYVHKSGLTIHQICLYTLSDDSLLYQEMLAYKASQASYYLVSSTDLPSEEDEDESDWEILAATRNANSIELPMSSPSYTSEDHAPSFSLGHPYPTHQLLVTATTPDYDAERYLRDSDVGVGFFPTPPTHQVTEAEVHIPSSSPKEIVSTSTRVHPDEVDTPISSVVDPSPLSGVATETIDAPVDTPSPVLTQRVDLPEGDKKKGFYPTRNSAVRVSSLLPESHLLPPGPRKRIVISSASSSCDASCDEDESELSEAESTDGPALSTMPLPLSAARKRLTGSYEYLAPSNLPPVGAGTVPPRSLSVSPTPRISPSGSYSEDDTVLVTRRRVDTHGHTQQQRSFFNLSPVPSMDIVEFTTPHLTGGTPNSSLTRSSSLRLPRERHISPYPSPATNSPRAAMATMSRTVPLSAIVHTQSLEYQISELVHKLLDGQGLPLIKPPALRRMSGYEKTRVMVLRQLETDLGVRRSGELKMATDSQILPVGVSRSVYRGLLDLLKYFITYIDEELQKEPEASIFSAFLVLRLAFSVFLLPKGTSSSAATKAKTPPGKSRPPENSPSFLPSISMEIAPAALTPGKTFAVSNSPNRSPVLPRRNLVDNGVMKPGDHDDKEETPQRSTADDSDRSTDEGERDRGDASMADNTPTPKVSHNSTHTSLYYTPSAATPPGRIPDPDSPSSHSNSTNPESHTQSNSSRPGSSASRDGNQPPPPRRPGSPLRAMHRRLRSEVDLNGMVTAKAYTRDTPFLYKDLTKALGQGGKAFMMERKFWNVLFMSVVTVERSSLGWNENTAELYQRYNSLSEAHRQAFGADEDYLLSLILHNLLVYMLALGKTTGETTDVIHRLTARTRLATLEEKQLQKTLRVVEQNSTEELDLSDLGLMSLYSEVHPTVFYIIHYGINMIAPVYKLQITSECLNLRRFPDERISMRLWNDRIIAISNNDRRATVTIHYRDNGGECKYHFHSKEFLKVYESLQILVSVGTILS